MPVVERFSLAVSACHPTAATTSAASALLRAPFFEKIMRTPLDVFSKDSIWPKFSCTCIPAPRKASATTVDTSSSSVDRIRGPASNSSTLDPKALKIEATCAPVAPPPITSIEEGTEVRLQARYEWLSTQSRGRGV